MVKQVKPILIGSGCQANARGQDMPLDPEQAGIAATIAGVARERDLSRRAVTIAYAAALQESKLHNLDYGDRDSIGVFQQRPSEGWGPASKLADPVYATSRFFRALTAIPGYQQLPVFKAAQGVQHSADGAAYRQYVPQASRLALAFTGGNPHAVWCWWPSVPSGRPKLAAASRSLAHAFGPRGAGQADPPRSAQADRPRSGQSDPSRSQALLVRAPSPARGWAVAVWLVTHAPEYRIHEVRYAGYQWQVSAGTKGWTRDPGPALADRVRAS